jgi:glycogen synthase
MIPMFGFTSPLTRAHGADLLLGALEVLLEEGVELQCAILTSKGEPELMEQAVKLKEKHPRFVGLHFGQDEALSHRTLAGMDVLVELENSGGGLSSVLRALRYGVVPLVYSAGPVRDVVTDWDGQGNAPRKRGAALLLDERDPNALADTMEDAMERYRKPRTWRPMITHGMGLDFSWAQAADGYVKVFEELLYEEEE